jgi:hypothetical protein
MSGCPKWGAARSGGGGHTERLDFSTGEGAAGGARLDDFTRGTVPRGPCLDYLTSENVQTLVQPADFSPVTGAKRAASTTSFLPTGHFPNKFAHFVIKLAF